MASNWKTLDKALELQQAHTQQKQELLGRRVLSLLAEGLSLKLIAERLDIGVWTVKTALRHARKKKKESGSAETPLTQTAASGTKLDGTK